MVVYNFKKLPPVPSANDFIDIVLTRTQRRTPTVVHPGYRISRIREFYMRKVKFTQQTVSERLGQIIQDFPRLDDIHPFYADLLNILYDKDHFKLALGQINVAKKLIETVSRDYVRLLKYGDSLYRCKQLKRAALGRMMTIIKNQKSSLNYLEEVRKHLARLPSLDPNTRTLLLTGYPNVGKSSFMNKITRANVDVQPYAFTTKSLFVGHMDYRYLRWQVIDTPGILDHPLEERNTIEMQAITALAHLQCCVVYIIDISEQCGYTISEQLRLFESIKPLFANKQLIVVCNKIDVVSFDELNEVDRAAIEKATASLNVQLHFMSNVNENGVSAVKIAACDQLLTARVDARLNSKKVNDVLNRLTVATPKARDDYVRSAFIPDSVIEAKMQKSEGYLMDTKRKTEKELMWENGGPGIYSCDFRKYYDLEREEWKFDRMPEIMDGKNVADFIDPEIEQRLLLLEQEEEQLEKEFNAARMDDESDVDEDTRILAEEIRKKRKLLQIENQMKPKSNSVIPRKIAKAPERTVSKIVEKLGSLGVDTSKIQQRGRSVTRNSDKKADGAPSQSRSKSLARSSSRMSRSVSRQPRDMGLKDEKMAEEADKKMKRSRSQVTRKNQGGESDRHSGPRLQKHLIAGKMGLGKKRSR